MSEPLGDAFDRRFWWSIVFGMLLLGKGGGSLVLERFSLYDEGHDGFTTSDLIFGSVVALVGICYVVSAFFRRSQHLRFIRRSHAVTVRFSIEKSSSWQSGKRSFWINTKSRELSEAGWMDWRVKIEQPYSEGFLHSLIGSPIEGTVWFDDRSAAPVAVRIGETTLVLAHGTPTAMKRS